MSLFVHALNANYVAAPGLGQISGRAFSEGVMGETDLAVSEKGTGTNMSVDVAVGALILHNPSGYGHILFSNAVENVAIAAADALNPRKSLIVAVLDTDYENNTDNDAQGGWSIIEVAGSAAAVPAEPDSTAIQTAAGAGNLYQVIALVDVGAAATEIEDADITDRRELSSSQLPAGEETVGPAARTGGFKVGTFTTNGSTGNQSITGLGFKPKMVEFTYLSPGGTTFGNGVWGEGVMDENGNQWAVGQYEYSTSGITKMAQKTTRCMYLTSHSGGSIGNLFEASHVSMDTDGFTFNIIIASSQVFGYKAYG